MPIAHIANLWSLVRHPSPKTEWSLERKIKAVADAGFDQCNEVRQAVLISMCFQLGDLEGWPRFRAALAKGDYAAASQEGLNSKWAREETPLRAMRAMQMLESGTWIPKGEIET